MSRSRKKHPCTKWCGRSNKRSKTIANRRFRKTVRILVKKSRLECLPAKVREIANEWSFDCDGTANWTPCPVDHQNPLWTEEAWKKILRK